MKHLRLVIRVQGTLVRFSQYSITLTREHTFSTFSIYGTFVVVGESVVQVLRAARITDRLLACVFCGIGTSQGERILYQLNTHNVPERVIRLIDYT